jgi:hypothetical protein
MTAGDACNTSTYWIGRQNGMLAAYAQMAGVSNSWTLTDAGISGHPMSLYTLTAKPAISLIFMHLPDGDVDGGGFPSTNYESLQELWQGSITTMQAIDGTSSYTKATLTSTLTAMMSAFGAISVNTQDYVGTFGDGDHSDHHAAAYFAQAAQQAYGASSALVGYLDYTTETMPANVTGADATAKSNAFYTYAPFDSDQCNTPAACAGSDYQDWLLRQYYVKAASTAPTANAGVNQSVAPGATVTLNGSASSDPGGKSLTYLWSQTGGTTVTLSSTTAVQPTFTAPSSAATLVFQLVVNDGTASSTPASVTITVSTAPAPNLALNAKATASSAASGQGAAKAIDGNIGGYPGNSSQEWASNGGKAGSWLKLTWTTPQTIDTIVLYDRPNLNDQITAGNIAFSDGSSIAVGSLPNAGTAYTLTFAAKTVTTLQLNITSVSSTTENVGLSEIQVYNR